MTKSMQSFVSVGWQMPEKREAELRREDFQEIYSRYSKEKAGEQASRCAQCGVPYCQVHCPVQNNIPDWLMLTAQGRVEEAYQVSQATNDFPEICGRICPQDRLCEGNCTLEQSGHTTVTIGAVEKYITDTAWTEGWVKPIQPPRELALTVGIVGAGPAGMAAAGQLRAKGYQVTIYDRYDRAGGLMIYGIPGFKLEKEIVERRVALLVDSGVTFKLNFEVGRDASLAELRDRHDALLLATGVYKSRDIKLPGAGLTNIFPALDYLTASNRLDLGDRVAAFEDGSLDARDKHVVVIGGGDTAMDCVRTAVRQGARSVKCLYRRNRENMPGSAREVANAEEEGVTFVWQAAPEAFDGADNKVEKVRVQRVHLGAPDATGRQTPQIIEDSSYEIKADIVIKALGFDPEDLPVLFQAPELETTRWGTVKVSYSTLMTSLDGVFAAGDIVRGASLVVWGIRDGRDAAQSIDRYLNDESATASGAKALAAD
jgi:glutamate synthase (NADPH/NADH) small chain